MSETTSDLPIEAQLRVMATSGLPVQISPDDARKIARLIDTAHGVVALRDSTERRLEALQVAISAAQMAERAAARRAVSLYSGFVIGSVIGGAVMALGAVL